LCAGQGLGQLPVILPLSTLQLFMVEMGDGPVMELWADALAATAAAMAMKARPVRTVWRDMVPQGFNRSRWWWGCRKREGAVVEQRRGVGGDRDEKVESRV